MLNIQKRFVAKYFDGGNDGNGFVVLLSPTVRFTMVEYFSVHHERVSAQIEMDIAVHIEQHFTS